MRATAAVYPNATPFNSVCAHSVHPIAVLCYRATAANETRWLMAHVELAAFPLEPTWTPNLDSTLESSHNQQVTAKPDVASRNQTIADHLPMVRFLARQVHGRLPKHVCLEDLISAGILGLVSAASRSTASNQVQFRNYAQRRIKGAMLDFLRTTDWGSRNLRRQERAREQAIQVLAAKRNFSPTIADVANEMGLPLAQYQHLLNDLLSLKLSSLQAGCEEGGEQKIEQIQGSPAEDPLFRCLQNELRNRLISGLDALPEKERLVLTLYYYEELTMQEIAQILSVVPSRISQIHASAISRLKITLAGSIV